MDKISFIPLANQHLDLMHQWLNEPHVIKWYTKHPISKERVVEKYTSYIQRDKPVYAYLAQIDDKPVAYIQVYLIRDMGDYHVLLNLEKEAAGIDLFIGEKEFLHKGFGSLIIKQFIKDIIFVELHVDMVVIGPEPENRAAIKAYKKAGFEHMKTFYNPKERSFEYLMYLKHSLLD